MLVIAALVRIPHSPDQIGVWAAEALGVNPPPLLMGASSRSVL